MITADRSLREENNANDPCQPSDLTDACPDESVVEANIHAKCEGLHSIPAAICYMQYLCEHHNQETVNSHKECIDEECPLARHVPPLNCSEFLGQGNANSDADADADVEESETPEDETGTPSPFPAPPENLSEYCDSAKVIDEESCFNECEIAQCCWDPSVDSCLGTRAHACAAYDPCKVLLYTPAPGQMIQEEATITAPPSSGGGKKRGAGRIVVGALLLVGAGGFVFFYYNRGKRSGGNYGVGGVGGFLT
jgi:hypothetical protein